MLGNNATIYDGKALFHADHSNLAASGAVISKDSVGAREAAMMTQKNLRGLEVLNINPSYMLIPVALKNTAKIFLKSGSDPDSLNPQIINPYQNSVQAIWDAELDGYSSTAWYLAASANDVDTIEVDYLNGDDMPKIESRLGFDFLGVEFRIFIDYGVTVLDYRGLQKDPGASA
jgi:phage major head subunit gpT-like protein